jgi:hypothetical protein
MKNKTMNNFQKMLCNSTVNKSYDDSKKLTFVDFKTKRDQKSNFFSYPDVKNIRLADKKNIKNVDIEPMAKTIGNLFLRKVLEGLSFQSNLSI